MCCTSRATAEVRMALKSLSSEAQECGVCRATAHRTGGKLCSGSYKVSEQVCVV